MNKVIDGKVYKIELDEFDIEAEKASRATAKMAKFGLNKKIIKKRPPQCFARTKKNIERYTF